MEKNAARRGFWADPQAATGKVITAEVDGIDMKELSVAFFLEPPAVTPPWLSARSARSK